MESYKYTIYFIYLKARHFPTGQTVQGIFELFVSYIDMARVKVFTLLSNEVNHFETWLNI